jgi:hypothetical protein
MDSAMIEEVKDQIIELIGCKTGGYLIGQWSHRTCVKAIRKQ